MRTTVNILGDSIGAGIVNHLCKKELDKMSREEDDSQLDGSNDLQMSEMNRRHH